MFQFVIWETIWWANNWCKVCYTSWLIDEGEHYRCVIVQKICVFDIVGKSIKTINLFLTDFECRSIAIICHHSLATIPNYIKLYDTISESKVASSNQAIRLHLCIRRIGLKHVLHGWRGFGNDKGKHRAMANSRRQGQKSILSQVASITIIINHHRNRRDEPMVGHIGQDIQMQTIIRISINSMYRLQKHQ